MQTTKNNAQVQQQIGSPAQCHTSPTFPPLECYHNGQLVICTFDEARERIRQATHWQVVPADMYGWDVEDFKGWSDVLKIAGKKGFRLSFYTHTTDGAYTIDEAERDLNGGKELLPNLFHVYAARFNRIFKNPVDGQALRDRRLWPFYYLDVPDGSGLRTRPSYRLNPRWDVFVVACIDPNAKYAGRPLPWSQLIA
ncbi:MAG: hypothetical protein IH624_13885 [Phycisphaerae bacterium]|nr:hypothetical protein [Phycisphaerae bacterium]